MQNELIRETAPFGISYSWQDKIGDRTRKQQMHLEPTGARNRGNFHATFDTYSTFALKPHLTNYYFSQAIAELEMLWWQEFISQTSNSYLASTHVPIELIKTITANNHFFTIVGDKQLVFDDGKKYYLSFFEAHSVNDLFTIDFADAFPRYYGDRAHAEAEEKAWVAVRSKEIQ